MTTDQAAQVIEHLVTIIDCLSWIAGAITAGVLSFALSRVWF